MTRTHTKSSDASSQSEKRVVANNSRTSTAEKLLTAEAPELSASLEENLRTTEGVAAKMLTAEELDALHESGADISAHVDYDKGIRPGRATQRVNVDFPIELLRLIDEEATRIGVTRQAFIKMRIADVVRDAEAGVIRKALAAVARNRRLAAAVLRDDETVERSADAFRERFARSDDEGFAAVVSERFANLLRLNDAGALREGLVDLLRDDVAVGVLRAHFADAFRERD